MVLTMQHEHDHTCTNTFLHSHLCEDFPNLNPIPNSPLKPLGPEKMSSLSKNLLNLLVECVFLVVDIERTHRIYDANLLRPLGGPLILSNKNKQCANSFWLSQCPRKHHPCCSRPDQCFLIRQPRPTEKPATFLLIRTGESAVITQSATLCSGTSTRAHTHIYQKKNSTGGLSKHTTASITRHPIQAPDSEGPLRKINRYLQQSITGFLWELIRKANMLRKLLFPSYLPQSSELSISIGMGGQKNE